MGRRGNERLGRRGGGGGRERGRRGRRGEGEGEKSFVHSKIVQDFFRELDDYSRNELEDEENKEWKCRVCIGGQGETQWWKGLGRLGHHAYNYKKRRGREHKEFAIELKHKLEERGVKISSLISDIQGHWSGLSSSRKEREKKIVVWPPVVMVVNTHLFQNGSKWEGMGNKELEEHFADFKYVTKRKHAYGPDGHRGMSILIFDTRHEGYDEAMRLNVLFRDENRGRNAWLRKGPGLKIGPDGKRLLHGWLATMEDMANFNQHFKGKSKVLVKEVDWREVVEIPRERALQDAEKARALELNLHVAQQELVEHREQAKGAHEKLRRKSEEMNEMRKRLVADRKKHKEEMNKLTNGLKDHDEFTKMEMERKMERVIFNLERKHHKVIEELKRSRREREPSPHPSERERRWRESETASPPPLDQSEDEEILEAEALMKKESGELEEKIAKFEKKQQELRKEFKKEQIETEKKFEKSLESEYNKFIDFLQDLQQTSTSGGEGEGEKSDSMRNLRKGMIYDPVMLNFLKMQGSGGEEEGEGGMVGGVGAMGGVGGMMGGEGLGGKGGAGDGEADGEKGREGEGEGEKVKLVNGGDGCGEGEGEGAKEGNGTVLGAEERVREGEKIARNEGGEEGAKLETKEKSEEESVEIKEGREKGEGEPKEDENNGAKGEEKGEGLGEKKDNINEGKSKKKKKGKKK